MVRVWFPNMFMKLINVRTNTTPAVAKLQIPPKMTKTEVKEYLSKIYQINVLDVSTANFLGKLKLIFLLNLKFIFSISNFFFLLYFLLPFS